MLKARYNTERHFSYFDSTGAGPYLALNALVYDPTDTLVATLPMTPIPSFPTVYTTDLPHAFATEGTYSVKFEDGTAGLLDFAVVNVGLDPVSDQILIDPVRLRLANSDLPAIPTTPITVNLAYQDKSVLNTDLATSANVTLGAQESDTDVTFIAEGIYFAIWEDADVPFFVDEIFIVGQRGLEVLNLVIGAVDGDASVPHTDVNVIVSRPDGTFITSVVTDGFGKTSASLFPGTYIITLDKPGIVFSKNNFELTVSDTQNSTFTNNFELITDTFSPAFSGPPAAGEVCVLTANLLFMDGRPMSNTEVLVTLRNGPISSTSGVAFGQSRVYQANASGYVEVTLLRGVEVEIAIMATSLRRVVTVPDLPTADLFDLMTGADDPFDIIEDNIDDAPRRTL